MSQPAIKDFYLFVFEHLKQGLNPTKISKQFGLSKQSLNYYLSSLKRQGFIKKIGYGTYEILKDYEPKQVKTTTRVAMNNPQEIFTSFKPDSVRAHAFQFTLSINPGMRNWNKRAEILQKLGIKFKELKIFGGGQSFTFKGRKVWLTSKSIIVFEKSSYMAETSQEARKYAVYDFIAFVGAMERFLKGDFGATSGKLRFKVSRQHYALIKNALAKQCDSEGNKLQVSDSSGQWFIIDNSFNLHEAETIHPKTADVDNEKVQTHFNIIKQTPLQTLKEITPQFILNGFAEQNKQIAGVTNNQVMFAENMKSHIKAVQELALGVQELRQEVKKINKSKHL
jgi:hypothetical protein